MAQLIDATHILCGESISTDLLQEADQLLCSFVNQFETLYGEEKMVFNVHQLRHLATCVKHIGPLQCYSNYCFEDHLGHLVALKKGTTDVATQICEKYILEKNMYYHLSISVLAEKFFDDINGRRKFKHSRKVSGSLLIGKPRNNLSEQDILLIADALQISNNFNYEQFNAVLLHNKIFYESFTDNKRKNDSFIFNSEHKKFGIIESIFVINDSFYFLVNEKFETLDDKKCKFNISLREINFDRKKILKPEFVGPKFVFIEFDNNINCSQFPNMFERD